MADLPSVNVQEIDEFKKLAGTDSDTSVVMLNLNKYSTKANYPEGELYKEYMNILSQLLGPVDNHLEAISAATRFQQAA